MGYTIDMEKEASSLATKIFINEVCKDCEEKVDNKE
jgi:hypothetical protein